MVRELRSAAIDPYTVGIYHCWNQIVQQRYLLGAERSTDSDLDQGYRKQEVRDRFRRLSGKLAIDFLGYAVLDNHFHGVFRNRPDIVEHWSDHQAALRWWYVCPNRRNRDGTIPEPRPAEMWELLSNIEEYRSRLSSISWLMRLACQGISRQTNLDYGTSGHFFAGRFECERLDGDDQILRCTSYVDLNVIRAGIAKTPEDSQFTSIWDRIRALKQQSKFRGSSVKRLIHKSTPQTTVGGDDMPDAWLSPIYLDGRASSYVGPHANPDLFCNPIGASRISNKGFLGMQLEDYIQLIDCLGRLVRADKRGFIPPDLPPILDRLQIPAESWLEDLWQYFDDRPLLA
jgi:hypothetical protein